ncbi:unnamed protein product [Periconia digitata]|uniref:Uncharacterized protein n=1 Tax=Periconia digitata TaxID=1303443 RepID=A0A9W4XRD1_9PLEO|nr:unnamed protein product [Periconia digitata]
MLHTSNTSAPSHQYLSPLRTSTILSWSSSLTEYNSKSTLSPNDQHSKDAAIEAYLQFKLALFAKTQTPHSPRPKSNAPKNA